ncbi:MAG TPA: flagellar basal body rod protein FlgC [Firmicutes bacterium]|jgi:flagellar basal-body rod protein FlgC|nr:flagellar basal body rod protein FlgC [Bacillota bacterium]
MPLFRTIDISASGLTAERLRMDVIASNIANANSTRSPNGTAYRRLIAVLEAAETEDGKARRSLRQADLFRGAGVRVGSVAADQSPLQTIYDPTHPDADAAGYVTLPNVNPVTEMVDLIAATRAYEANVTVLNATKQMALKALEIGKA